MFSRFTRAALPALLIVLVAIAVTLTFSPEARAAVQALMSFNGVTVSLGDDGKLTATGNTDAIVHQDDYSVAVQSDDGCQVQGISVAPPPTSEYLATADVLAQNPDLVLPKVPAGYTLAPQAEVVSDGRIVLNWADTSDHTIMYARNSAAPLTIAVGADSTTACQPGTLSGPEGAPPVPDVMAEPGVKVEGQSVEIEGEAGPTEGFVVQASGGEGEVAHAWEADGFIHLLTASDPALSVDDLKAMQP